ncbi:MAG: MBOAT family protein [Clostridiales bacterium]|nr:MBOAT family protein [Clostridiales bacterium]
MTFDSAIFLFCFFPVLFVLYRLVRTAAARRALLLLAGLVFCAFGRLSGLVWMVAAASVNYLFGRILMRTARPKPWRVLAVTLNLAFLGAFKYLDFLVGSLSPLPGGSWEGLGLAVPAGISFFTFKGISYVLDVSRDPSCGSRRYWDVLLYISFFPQVMAGPIARFPDFAAQLETRDDSLASAARGLRRLTVGLAKKLIFAAGLGKMADAVFALDAAALTAPLAWLGALAYLLQIYFDFSGYSDMAIGLGRVFGFDTTENFQWPYRAASVGDFWRRWHISLSRWFRDYLYIPLGGSRRGLVRTGLNKMLVFTLCGLWHGANWTFVLWGLWHGVLTALEAWGLIPVERLGKTLPGRILSHVYTLLCVCLGFVMFRADSVGQGFAVIGAMFAGGMGGAADALQLHALLTGYNVFLLLAGAVCSLPLVPALQRRLGARGADALRRADGMCYGLCAVLLALCLTALAAGGFAPFIYFQF